MHEKATRVAMALPRKPAAGWRGLALPVSTRRHRLDARLCWGLGPVTSGAEPGRSPGSGARRSLGIKGRSEAMSTSAENVESMLFRSGAPFDQLDPTTWVLRIENRHRSRVIVKVAEPIVLFSVPLGTLDDSIGNREALYRTLLEFNADFMHNAYAIEGERVVLSGALQTENLDANEFQAIIDDLTMTLDQHLDKLADWKLGTRPTAEA
jgi:hypothetical protein